MAASTAKSQDNKLLAKGCIFLNRRGQNFIYGEVAGEFRMLQADYGPLRGGVAFPGKGLAVVVRDNQASIYAYEDAGASSDLHAPMPKPAWAAFSVNLAGAGAIAVANRLQRALQEMHGIHELSGMESVAG